MSARSATSASALASVLILLAAFRAPAQSNATQLPSYEVTSVKIDPNGDPNRSITWDEDPSSLRVTNVTLELLIRQAYGVMSYQIVGAPEWVKQDEYDVSAMIGEDESRKLRTLDQNDERDERRRMLQSLLSDRFSLALHRETKEGTVYVLVVAKNGPKFQPAPPPVSNGEPGSLRTIIMENGLLTFKGAPIASLVRLLSQVIGRPVRDGTGLTGTYSFNLTWAEQEFDLAADDQTAAQQQGGAASPASIFTNLQQQLGLRLESTKGAVESLVIDHVKQPAPN